MNMSEIFAPARAELERFGFQSPRTVPMVYARPLSESCWAMYVLRGTEAFAVPMTALTLPNLGNVLQKYVPMLRYQMPKDYDGRFIPPLMYEEVSMLGEANPIWGPEAGQQRGTSSMGQDEFRALAQSMDRHAHRLQQEGWTEDRVLQHLLALPPDDPQGRWSSCLALVWFARRGDWEAFDDHANQTPRIFPQVPDFWQDYVAKIYSHFADA